MLLFKVVSAGPTLCCGKDNAGPLQKGSVRLEAEADTSADFTKQEGFNLEITCLL